MHTQHYNIYSHADADGGIASAIFTRYLRITSGNQNLPVNVFPVNHGPDQQDWTLTEIKYPCAILDFSLHPSFLTEKFFSLAGAFAKPLENPLGCYWIDHHPTGAGVPFLTPENCQQFLTHVRSLWDVTATSTPGLMRKHHKTLGIPQELIEEYEELIDQAEIIDAALFADAQSAHDFSTKAVKLQTLFSCSHPSVDRTALYRNLVQQLISSPRIEDLMNSDPLYQALIHYEQDLVLKQKQVYATKTKVSERIALSNFMNWSESETFPGMGRFVPYLLYPEILYAIHVQPHKSGVSSISCGINPWNKPKVGEKHLGNYFATHFGGGGHAFVAGGRITTRESHKIDELVNFLKN
ncbi:MAG: hypothetical protein FJY29_08380 [Betaproteobacteria bacterium]|nr:hypothetical protein [Betaproteobacteria bacterium]